MKTWKNFTFMVIWAMLIISPVCVLLNGCMVSTTSVKASGPQSTVNDYIIAELNSGFLIILDYIGTNKDVIIPRVINGKIVRAIGDFAFAGATIKLDSIVLPDTINAIGKWAFYDNNLTTILVPDSVTFIGDGAFVRNKIFEMTLGANLETIGERCFYDNLLTSVNIPNKVKSIGEYAFSTNNITDIVIGESVTQISDYCFSDNQIVNVFFGNAIRSIGAYAFANNNITELNIGDRVVLKESCFANNNITKLSMGNDVFLEMLCFENNEITLITIGGRAVIKGEIFSNSIEFQNYYYSHGKKARTYEKITELQYPMEEWENISIYSYWKEYNQPVPVPQPDDGSSD